MITLISSIFDRLLLKGNKIEVSQPITDDEVEAFFRANHRLDKELNGNERNEDLYKHLAKAEGIFGPLYQVAPLLLFN